MLIFSSHLSENLFSYLNTITSTKQKSALVHFITASQMSLFTFLIAFAGILYYNYNAT